jgi:hypothetical protein
MTDKNPSIESKPKFFTPKQRSARREHYELIGTIASAWAALEATIDIQALRMAKIDIRPGLCFTAQMSGHGRKLDAYFACARLRGAESDKEWDKFPKKRRHFLSGETGSSTIHG